MQIQKKESVRKIVYGVLFLVFLGVVIYLFCVDSKLYSILKLDEIVLKAQYIFPKLIVLITLFFLFKLISVFLIEFFVGRFMEAFETRARIKSIKKIINFFLWVVYFLISLFVFLVILVLF